MRIIWLIICLLPTVAFSQEKATFSFENTSASEVFFSLEKTYKIRFSYSDKIVKNKKITLQQKQRTLQEVLLEIEEKTSFYFEKINERYIIIKEKKKSFDEQQLEEIVINYYLTKGISKNKKAYYLLKPHKLEILPGLIEADVLESIQLLPGVISANETATGLLVRGGTTDQNRVLWDGINMYHNGHLFGMISPFNSSVSQKITFHNKGTNPRFGERVSSVIDIKTSQNIPQKLKTKINLNGISGDLVFETPILKDKLGIQISARSSYANLFPTNTFHKLTNKVFQSTKITNSKNTNNNFYFLDYNVKINYYPTEKNHLSVSVIFIDNELDYVVKDIDNNLNYNDLLRVKNDGYALDWNVDWTSKISQKTTFSQSKYKLNYNFIKTTANNDEQVSNFDKRNFILDTHFSTELELKTNQNNKFNAGYQYALKDVSYAFLNTTDLEFVLDFDKNKIATHSFYSNYSYKNQKNIAFDIGFRTSYYQELKTLKFEPRIVIYKKIYKNLGAQLTGEIKNQIISQIDETVLSDLSLENRLWKLANGETFPIIHSKQISAGLLYSFNGWSFDLDNYYKNTNGITALSLGFLNPDGKTFRIGKQKTTGIDFYVKKDFNAFKTWVSYSYTDVKSKFTDLNNENYFTANTNITHAFSTSISYKINKFQIALGWKWRTGKPYTESETTNGTIVFNGINTERLSNYHRLDFSSTYGFYFSNKNRLKGKVGFSIRNVYNQKNHLSKEYTGFNNLNDPVTVLDKFSVGFMPNFLLKVYW